MARIIYGPVELQLVRIQSVDTEAVRATLPHGVATVKAVFFRTVQRPVPASIRSISAAEYCWGASTSPASRRFLKRTDHV